MQRNTLLSRSRCSFAVCCNTPALFVEHPDEICRLVARAQSAFNMQRRHVIMQQPVSDSDVEAHPRLCKPPLLPCRSALQCSITVCARLHFLITYIRPDYRQSATWKCTGPPHDTTTAELVCRAAVSGSNRSSEWVTRMMFIRETFGCCDMSGYCRCRRMPPVRLPNLMNKVVRCTCCKSSAAGGLVQPVLTCASLICRMPH